MCRGNPVHFRVPDNTETRRAEQDAVYRDPLPRDSPLTARREGLFKGCMVGNLLVSTRGNKIAPFGHPLL